MARSVGRRRPRTLRGRVLFVYVLIVAGAFGVVGLMVDRQLQRAGGTEGPASARVALILGFVVVAVAGLALMLVVGRRLSRPLAQVTAALEHLGRGADGADLPVEDSEETASLVAAIARTRQGDAARLEASERGRRTLDDILASLDEGVVLFDTDGRVVYRNPAATRMLGVSVESVRQLSPSAMQRVVAEGARSATREEIVSTGPAPRTVLAAAGPASSDGGVLLVLRDVTEPRRLEAVRRDFVANASHELKTPAASIQALAETIASAAGDDPAAVERFAEQLQLEAERMARMVSDLLDLSRLEGEPGLKEQLRLDRLVTAEAERHRSRAEAAGLDFEVRASEPVRVRGSRRDLTLLVRNLLENAIQYSRPGGRVEVSVSKRNGDAVIEVRDAGVGIPARDLSRVFERFYRVDRARSRATGGTGLGLSIVKHVAESQGGTVDVESQLGQGSAFTVRLPLDEGDGSA